MQIEVRSDKVIIDGYVNVTEKESRAIITKRGMCNETIEARTFEKALAKASNVDLLLNHDETRKLGSTDEKNLELREDAIGLKAHAVITDPEVIEKARNKKLRGWSFKMKVNKDAVVERAGKLPLRKVMDMDIFEVSLIDERKNPCYAATSIEVRSDETEDVKETRSCEFSDVTITEDKKVETPEETVDQNSAYKNRYMRTRL